MVNSSVGRPRGGSDARERLVNAAHAAFLRDGYARVSMRAVAREAGVSHTLVNYYFGGKDGLFGEVMAISLRPSRLVAGALAAPAGADRYERATRMVETLLSVWDDRATSEQLVVLLREAVGSVDLRGAVAEFVENEIYQQLLDRIGGRDARARTSALVSAMAGMIFTRYVLALEPVASLPRAELVRAMVPMVAVQLR